MTRAIPEQIVAAVTRLAESLARWCEEGRDGRLEQHEAAVLERVRQVLPTLLQAVVEVATSGLAPRVRGQRSACPQLWAEGPTAPGAATAGADAVRRR